MKKYKMADMLPDWALSGRCFLLATLPYILQLTSSCLSYTTVLSDNQYYLLVTTAVIHLLLLLAVKVSVRPSKFDIAWRAFFLGTVFNTGLSLATYTSAYQTLGIYLIVLSIFHWSEYMTQAIFNPETTNFDNYMLYHSHAYVVAFFAALVEFAIEFYFWPWLKLPNIVTNLGILLVLFGECLRKASMWTAKSNFNHYVQFDKHADHKLVTNGVYALFRHPAYVGWFWWSIGTQCLLFNPLCIIAYTAASWSFFSQRIYTEEMTLIKFFDAQYMEYQKKVGTGLPFIKGFSIDTEHVEGKKNN